ncbi:MAG: hypothetical protein KAT91_00260 [Candidatus Aenigmarchaeota archaeon]|nr:hypothetical protein [Candidatus Aenigmarchaeota archaeon]
MNGDEMSNIGVIQIGFGQQGKRNIQKLSALQKEGYPLELIAISDINPSQFKQPITPDTYLKNLFPDTTCYVGRGANAIREYPRVNVVLDSSSTVWEGMDIHGENMAAFLETHSKKGNAIYATEDLPTYRPTYGVEKPVTMTLALTSELIRNFKKEGIYVLENAVESFMPTKMASVDDITKNELEILNAEYARLSSTQKKSVDTNRLVIHTFGGAWHDKAPHDLTKFFQTYYERYGAFPDISIHNAKLDILEILTPKKKVHIDKLGEYRGSVPEDMRTVNESYADAAIQIGDTEARFICSHLGAKPEHLELINSWFTPEIKQEVARAATENGRTRTAEDVRGAYGTNHVDLESRTEHITCRAKNGEIVKYLTQTFGKPVPSFFTARTIGDGDVNVLQEGPSDGHLLFVKNIMDVALDKENPIIPIEVINVESEILERVDRTGNRDGREELNLLSSKNNALAEMMKPELKKAGFW